MGNLALAPAAVAFPVVFCLTYFLCVGPRRALAARRWPARSRWRPSRSGSRRAARAEPAARPASGSRTSRPSSGGWRSRGCSPSRAGTAFGAWRDAVGAARHEVSSSRRAARRLKRRASHQAPPARSTNGPPTMAAKSAPRPTTEITPRASSAVPSKAPVLRGRRDRRAAAGVELEREARERCALLRRVHAAQHALERALGVRQAALERRAILGA